MIQDNDCAATARPMVRSQDVMSNIYGGRIWTRASNEGWGRFLQLLAFFWLNQLEKLEAAKAA